MPPTAEPDWLTTWRKGSLVTTAALAAFDALAPVTPAELQGKWKGAVLKTGHVLDAPLIALGWSGKNFETADRVHPMLMATGQGKEISLNPKLLPLGLAMALPALAAHPITAGAFKTLAPMLTTPHPSARLRQVMFRGKLDTGMVYNHQPIIDYFRRIDGETLLGIMEQHGHPRPLFFLLYRERKRIEIRA
ncbi:MAG: DUF4334 domain-containing protein [Paracoccaceae bacterium]